MTGIVQENALVENLLQLESDLLNLKRDFEDGWILDEEEYTWHKNIILRKMEKAREKLNNNRKN